MQHYNNIKEALFNGNVDLDSETIEAALVGNNTSYTPDSDTESVVDDVLDDGTTAEELDDTSYERKAIPNASVSLDTASDEAVLDGDDVSWPAIDTSQSIQGVLVYVARGSDSTNLLIGYDDSDSDFPLPTNGSDVTMQWDSDGITALS